MQRTRTRRRNTGRRWAISVERCPVFLCCVCVLCAGFHSFSILFLLHSGLIVHFQNSKLTWYSFWENIPRDGHKQMLQIFKVISLFNVTNLDHLYLYHWGLFAWVFIRFSRAKHLCAPHFPSSPLKARLTNWHKLLTSVLLTTGPHVPVLQDGRKQRLLALAAALVHFKKAGHNI